MAYYYAHTRARIVHVHTKIAKLNRPYCFINFSSRNRVPCIQVLQ